MENPIEHLDLGFVNYTQHPTNPKYMVYRFTDINRANDFREMLNVDKIEFQEDTQEKKQQTFLEGYTVVCRPVVVIFKQKKQQRIQKTRQ